MSNQLSVKVNSNGEVYIPASFAGIDTTNMLASGNNITATQDCIYVCATNSGGYAGGIEYFIDGVYVGGGYNETSEWLRVTVGSSVPVKSGQTVSYSTKNYASTIVSNLYALKY